MPEHLYIAEKPSLAEALAKARASILGVKAQKGQGAWTVGNDAVTWLFGHMYELANPDDYDTSLKQWKIEHLPIIPDKWRRSPHKDKAAHLKIIKELLKNSKYVVNAGDAEREGQLLVDELLEEMGWDPFSSKTKRVWVSSMAEKDVIKAINDQFPNIDKRNLSIAAVLRQRADWLHGLNLTRMYTILARNSGANMLISVGRVQTPTLKLVVDRDREIESFKPVDHYLPTGLFKHDNGSFRADYIIPEDCNGLDSEGRLIDKKIAEAICLKISGKTGNITDFSTSIKSKAPPLPYSLSALQAECSSKLSLTAQETLEVAQSLYETHKATTYPRSDSRYLPRTILNDEAPGIMAALASTPGLDAAAQKADLKLRSKAWDDSKVTDHHGIIPTSEFSAAKLAKMSPIERKVFELIAKAFIAQFHPDQTWKSVTAKLNVAGENFKATGRIPIANGWRVVYGAEADEDDEEEKESDQNLPDMKKGDSVLAEKGAVTSKRTTPPPYFNDGTLIAAMTNVHKFVTDVEVKKRLRENDGLGTEATRANIIETLLKRKFLERKGKTKLVSTKEGRSVIDALDNEVTSPGLTAIWEAQLQKISRGEASETQFTEILLKSLRSMIEKGKGKTVTIKGASIEPLQGHGETCPKCGAGKMVTRMLNKGEHKGKKFLVCDAYNKDDPDSCRHAVWPNSPKKDVKPIEGHGETCPQCGKGKLVTREIQKGDHKGKKFLSCDSWSKDNPNSCNYSRWPEVKVTPLDGHGSSCTKCNTGIMVTRMINKGDNKGKTFLSCSAYPDCDNSIFPDNLKSGKSSKFTKGSAKMSFGKKPFRK